MNYLCPKCINFNLGIEYRQYIRLNLMINAGYIDSMVELRFKFGSAIDLLWFESYVPAHVHVRLCINDIGGLELDQDGAKKRKWRWNDKVKHTHAPPLCTVNCSITSAFALQVATQHDITLTFNKSKQTCRFHVGSSSEVSNYFLSNFSEYLLQAVCWTLSSIIQLSSMLHTYWQEFLNYSFNFITFNRSGSFTFPGFSRHI